jgi:restriction system protein
MPIPDYQSIMLPLLKQISDGQVHKFSEVKENLAREFKLTPQERRELLPSGRQTIFDNRVGWARTYLKKANLLHYPQRGELKINERGQRVLKEKPDKINIKYLKQFGEFVDFITPSKSKEKSKTDESDTRQTPEEVLENTYAKINNELSYELLNTIKQVSPTKFEELVIDLLLEMGYGGSRKEAGEVTGKSGDGGIDGIIKEDRLGLDKVYIQAKRWDKDVPVKEVRDFVGAISGEKARKGIFITTSGFPKSAFDYIGKVDRTIILIDGTRLAELLIEYNIGVAPRKSIILKEIDSDYFEE